MRPGDPHQVAGQGEVVIPAPGLCRHQMRIINRSLDECVEVDIFIPQFPEAMPARFVLDQPPEIIGIIARAHGHDSEGRAVVIQIGHARVAGRGEDEDHQGLRQLADRGLESIGETSVEIRLDIRSHVILTAEFRLPNGVQIADTTVLRAAEHDMDVEVVPVCVVGLYGEEVLHGLQGVVEVFLLADVFRIIAVAHEDQFHPPALAVGLRRIDVPVAIRAVILFHLGGGVVILPVQPVHDFPFAETGSMGKRRYGDRHIRLPRSGHGSDGHPVRLARHGPGGAGFRPQDKGSRLGGVQRPEQPPADGEFPVGDNPFEFIPTGSVLIVLDGRFRNLQREIVLGNAFKCLFRQSRNIDGFANNRLNIPQIPENTRPDMGQILGKNQSLDIIAIVEAVIPKGFQACRKS